MVLEKTETKVFLWTWRGRAEPEGDAELVPDVENESLAENLARFQTFSGGKQEAAAGST